MTALRDLEGKLEWARFFEGFPLALQEICRARQFGARHYTKEGKDGWTNWRESIGTPEHESFKKGCIRGGFSHGLKCLWGEERDEPQDNVHHLAFAALNNIMALEYALNEHSVEPYQWGVKTTRFDWSKAPEWAQWAAIDLIGVGFWFENEPCTLSTIWGDMGNGGSLIGHNMLRDGEDWTTTLEERPQA